MVSGSASDSWVTNVVALTGTIGSGKSYAGRWFEGKGAFVRDADSFARKSIERGTPGNLEVIRTFGPAILNDNGDVDRAKLAKIVFADPLKRKSLEDIVHPITRTLADQDFTSPDAIQAVLRIYEVPLLFETGMNEIGFQAIILVHAPTELCVARTLARKPHQDEGVVRQILKTQLQQVPLEQRARLSTYSIDNSGSLDQFEQELGRVFDALRNTRPPVQSS